MCLDVGTRTIGIALSDPMAVVAQPAGVVRRRSLGEDVEHLSSIMRANEVGKVVVGLPKNMDGSLGESAARAKRLAQALGACTGVPVVFWDERLSTVSAERALIEADVSRRRRKGLVDSVAAAVILQGYLDNSREAVGEDGEDGAGDEETRASQGSCVHGISGEGKRDGGAEGPGAGEE
jgi:putative Holliday junction resolvase